MIFTAPVQDHAYLGGTYREYGPPDVEFEWNAHDLEVFFKLLFMQMGYKVKW